MALRFLQIIYGEALAKGHKDSINARYFTSIVCSDRLAKLTPAEYERLLKTVSLAGPGENHPPYWLMDPVHVTLWVKQPAVVDISKYARDIDGDSLSFTGTAMPAWLKLDPSGRLIGTPTEPDAGARFVVRASDGKDTALVTVVVKVSKPPLDVLHFETPAEFVFSADLWSAIGPGYRYAKVSGPAWVSVSADGKLFGTPRKSDVGLNELFLRITDSHGMAFEVSVRVRVTAPSDQRPRFKQDVFTIRAKVGKFFALDLMSLLEEPVAAKLSWRVSEMPSWLVLDSENHRLSGVPGPADVGKTRHQVTVHHVESGAMGLMNLIVER